jgi:SPASM domain peptide maturase of grasp-with-spasm system
MSYFKIFANCIITKGFIRSLICDLQRRTYVIIPNDLVEIIDKLNNSSSIEDVFKYYGTENKKTISDYIDYLIVNEFGFVCDTIDEFNSFPALQTDFVEPKKITNAVIEYSSIIENNLNGIAEQLNYLQCKHLILFIYDKVNAHKLTSIIRHFAETRISSLEIISEYHKEVDDHFFTELNSTISALTKIIFYNAPFEKFTAWDKEIFFDRCFTNKNIDSFKHCGIVHTHYFNTNFPKVLEAINHNSCLHKKISIDITGEIKNCPAMPESFGNIMDVTLQEALENEHFKKYWNITKDDIETCKQCEFRYVCTDCRAFTERTHISSNNIDTSKPLKCGYNPYTAEWEEWNLNPLKKKQIEYYGMVKIVDSYSNRTSV